MNLDFFDGRTVKNLQFTNIASLESENEESFARFNRFFRIPVLEKQRSFYSFDLGSNGKIDFFTSLGNISEDGSDYTEEAFELDMRGYDSGSAFYMLFDAHIEYPADSARERADAVVDTSMIPGGYGIYKLPYDSQSGELFTDSLETVYRLDPRKYNEIVSISPDGENMLITVSDGKSIHAELISLKDMKLVQRIELPIFSGKAADAENGLLKYMGHREVELTEGGAEAATLFYTDGCYCLLSYENGRYKSELSFTAEEMNLGNETESIYSLGILGSLDSDESIRLAYDGSSPDGLDGNNEFFSDSPYSLTQPQRSKLWIRL